MNKVTHISSARSYKKGDVIGNSGLSCIIDITHLLGTPAPQMTTTPEAELERLDQASDHHLLALLELVHRNEEHEREQAQARDILNQELEATVYAAMLSGVPEQDIYERDEHLAMALESAIRKVGSVA